jgi:hypothetical protein
VTAILDETPYLFIGSRIEFDNRAYDGFPRATDAERAEFDAANGENHCQCLVSSEMSFWYCSRNVDHPGAHIGMSDAGDFRQEDVIVVGRWFDTDYVYVIPEEVL